MANEKTPSTAPETSETAKVTDSSEKGKTDASPGVYKVAKEQEEEFIKIYGEQPTAENVIKRVQESPSFKDKSYDEIMDIRKNGIKDKDGKYDPSLQNKDLYYRLKDNVNKGITKSKEETKEEQEEIEKEKNETKKENVKKIEEKKKELMTPQPNTSEKKTGEGTIQNTPENSRTKAPENSRTKAPENSRTKPSEEKKPEEKIEKTPEPKPEKKASKPSNRNLNPFKALKHVGKKGLELLAMPLHVVSKAATTISRPQDIFKRQYRKDIGTNIGRGAKSMAKTFTGLIYAPHRQDTQYVNTSQGYAKTQGPTGINKPEAAITSFGWSLGKLPKLAANIVAGTSNALAETLDSVRTGNTDYSDTKMAFVRAGSRNPQGKSSK